HRGTLRRGDVRPGATQACTGGRSRGNRRRGRRLFRRSRHRRLPGARVRTCPRDRRGCDEGRHHARDQLLGGDHPAPFCSGDRGAGAPLRCRPPVPEGPLGPDSGSRARGGGFPGPRTRPRRDLPGDRRGRLRGGGARLRRPGRSHRRAEPGDRHPGDRRRLGCRQLRRGSRPRRPRDQQDLRLCAAQYQTTAGSTHMTTIGGATIDGQVTTVDHKKVGEESLAPQTTRIMDPWSYFFAWLGGCVSIGTFTVGSGLVGTLNLLQVFLAIAIGCTVIGIALMINGPAGHRAVSPSMRQARSAFGFTGTGLPALVRSVPAIVWFGVQSWIGAGALNLVSVTLFDFDNIVFYFLAFQFLQIGLSVLGLHGIKWLENIGSVFIVGSLIYMFFSVINRYGAEISTNLVNVEGTWGAPFWGATML